jgi:hypothetical protein
MAALWSFQAIADNEPNRARRLEQAPSWQSLRSSIAARFSEAISTRTLAIALEQSSEDSDWTRAVLQFHVGEELLDHFFNARTGYRAQYRCGEAEGLKANEQVTAELRAALLSLPQGPLDCYLLSPSFAPVGRTLTTREWLYKSVDPRLSKLWACALVLQEEGPPRFAPLGVTTPPLTLPDGDTWRAITQEECDAHLEVKGAFVRPTGLYQPKPPEVRALALHLTGEPGFA